MSDVAEKLREARKLIEQGWTKGWFVEQHEADGPICYCVYGALNQVVVGDAEADTTETDAAAKLLGRAVGQTFLSLATWNDAPERTQAEVLAAFDRAIELADQSA